MAKRLYLVAGKVTDSVTYGFLPAAARLGLEVVILTDRPDEHRRVCDTEVLGCDVTDFRALLACMRSPDAVFSNSDHLQAPAALAAAYHGLPGKDWRAAARTKDKSLMRRHLAEAGLEMVLCTRLGPPGPGADGIVVDRPMVVKPAGGVASEDVHLVQDIGQLTARVAEIRTRREDPLIVEEYLPGRLHTLETLGDGRDLRVLGSFRTTLSPPPVFIEERMDWAPPPPETAQVLDRLAALGVGFGACHTEFVVHEGRARLIEVNYRVIGDHCDLLLADLLGIPLFEYVLRVHLGDPVSELPGLPPPSRPSVPARACRAAVVDYVVAGRSGRLTAETPGPLRHSEAGVSLTYRPHRRPGDPIVLTRTNRDYLGTIRAIGPDPAVVDDVIGRFREAHSWEIA